MARQPGVQYAGGTYQVMNRGDRRATIFEDDRDGQVFVEKTVWTMILANDCGLRQGCHGCHTDPTLSELMVILRRFPSVGPPPRLPRRSNAGLSDAILSGG